MTWIAVPIAFALGWYLGALVPHVVAYLRGGG